MLQFPDISILDNISVKSSDTNVVFQKLLQQFGKYLNIELMSDDVQVLVSNESSLPVDIFDFGTLKIRKKNLKIIKIYSECKKFLPFIILREILMCFINKELTDDISIKLTINQMVMTILSKNPLLSKWKSMIRKEIDKIDEEEAGIRYTTNFERLNRFFNYYSLKLNPNPIQFFFKYLNEHPSLIKSKYNFSNYILFKNYRDNLIDLLKNNSLAETLYSIISIFYRVKKYSNLLEYKKFFQSFKEQELLRTDLSLRKFTENMDLIKRSFIAPSYQINWNAINSSVLLIYLKFNPLISQSKINKIITNLPFLISPKKSIDCFSNSLFGYIVLPTNYLNDSLELLKGLKNEKFLIEYKIFLRLHQEHILNLNYFKKEFSKKVIPHPNYKSYDQKYVINAKAEFGDSFHKYPLSIIDFLIFDRIRWFSFSGLGFERNEENVALLKSDLFDEITSQRSFISNLKQRLKIIYKNKALKEKIIELIKNNREFGFFLCKEKIDTHLELIKTFESKIINTNIQDYDGFKNSINSLFTSIEENINFKKDTDVKRLIEEYFASNKSYLMEFKVISNTSEILKICASLKIYNLNWLIEILTNENLAFRLFQVKDQTLYNILKDNQVKDISSQFLTETLDKFIENDPPIIFPLLVNTIGNNIESDYFQVLIKNYSELNETISLITEIFPRTLFTRVKDLNSEEVLYYLEFSLPLFTQKEKRQFISILFNLFNQNIIYGKNHIWSGLITGFSIKNFYDYENNDFFYTKDLFNQYHKYAKIHFEEIKNDFEIFRFENNQFLWSGENDIFNFVESVNIRKAREKEYYDLNYLKKLYEFYLNLENELLNIENFLDIKDEQFFQDFVKAIKFIPAFHCFGINQNILYFYSSNLNQINFKFLKDFNFLKIEYPAAIDDTISFFLHYLSSSVKSKNLIDSILKTNNEIRELFDVTIKKTYLLFHFEINYSPEGWIYDPLNFQDYFHNLLFKKESLHSILNLRMFDFTSNMPTFPYKKNSSEFIDLCETFSYKSLDIKTYLGTKKRKTVDRIQLLLMKKLIFPYITIKNLGFREYLYIILPNLRINLVETLVKIFSWFNYGFIHEIKGRYFINGFDCPVNFPKGLLLKIYFPKCEIVEFIKLFEILFEYLEIDHYLILKDFINGDPLVKNVYEDPNFFDNYHPLRNVKNDGKDENK